MKRVCWHKNTTVPERNKIRNPWIITYIHGEVIYNKEAKNVQWGKDSL